MTGSVILSSPLLLILYGIALGLSVYDMIKKTGFLLPVLSALLVVSVSAYALLHGAGLFEIAAAATLFLVVQLIGLRRDEE